MNSKVIEKTYLTDNVFKLKITRSSLQFNAGQFAILGIDNYSASREYSIASSIHDDFLEFIIMKVPEGYLSNKLGELEPGDTILVDGPFGNFTLSANYKKLFHYFIATGTGIAPFISIINSTPDLEYLLIEGNNIPDSIIWHKASNHILCSTKKGRKDFDGRVTDYLQTINPKNHSVFFLCGNRTMIDDVRNILYQKKCYSEIRTEPFF